VNGWTSGWFDYDHYPPTGEPNREAFIESNNHPIRPSTIESAPDRELLLKASHPPAYESENLIMKAITTGAARQLFLNAMKKADGGSIMATKRLNWLWCENGPWCTTYSPHLHRKEFGFDVGNLGSPRLMVAIPNANHFLQWEDPEKFIKEVIPLL